MRISALLLTAAVILTVFGFTRGAAVASGTPLSICNKSSATIDVAVGYASSGPDDTSDMLNGPFVSRGWYVLAPGACTTAANPFGARYMYWTGYEEREGGSFWNSKNWHGDSHFCTPNVYGPSSKFNFERQNESESACESSEAYGSAGANMWVPAQEVDVSVDPSVEYDGD
jgi:uncharacterized membrane protein